MLIEKFNNLFKLKTYKSIMNTRIIYRRNVKNLWKFPSENEDENDK
jgi:hypothetical protein